MDYIKFIGFASAFLTTFSFFPQAYKTLKTRDTSGISLLMYCAFTAGVSGWLVYGIMQEDFPMILGNLITLIPACCILWLTFRNKAKKHGV